MNRIAGIALISLFLAVSPAFAIFGIENLFKVVKEGNRSTQVELQAIKEAQINTSAKVEATASAVAKIDAKLDANATAIAGVGNKVQQSNTTTSEQVGRDRNTSTVNDSMIFIKYVESQEELAKVYEKIIIILICQLCALLTLFIRKDWDLQKNLLKFISEDEAREDNRK